ncbi:MAG TPA: type II toxin-antitoxin system RelE/ParE family toxin [Aggregatilinea sp.]|uniref:type II toxin-antitoxin system RelE family toxin n=1 Tax=Aggregatilinea sp. TaxID=2806333 RepID=UPI002C328642|nr:type II toxin-antitoxin system RelE/ParE family toxin [Aggregatilinea sp.]HML21312.1 type II toxin-antitoxin system RelE/ParE family toxin [Aggregatilinea sp.]
MSEPDREWQIVVHRRAEKVLGRLPKDVLQRLMAAIRDLARDPRPDGCKKLSGYDNLYRVRVGDWRISYAVEDVELVVLVLEVAPRGGAYRNL